MNIFAERLKYLRSTHGLTQKKLAELTGLSERGVQNYELGSRKPTVDSLIAFAKYFNVSTDYLLGLDK